MWIEHEWRYMIAKAGCVEAGKVYCSDEEGVGKREEDSDPVGTGLLFHLSPLTSRTLRVSLSVLMTTRKSSFLSSAEVKTKFLICAVPTSYPDIPRGIDISRDFQSRERRIRPQPRPAVRGNQRVI